LTIDEFASRLRKPKPFRRAGQRGFRASCPAHDDRSPSFAVWEGVDGYLHVKCQAGCSEDAILASLGMTQEDRRVGTDASSRPVEEAVYAYTGADGGYKFEKVRLRGPSGKKDFRLRTKDASGNLVYSVASLNGWRGTLYALPDVKRAIREGLTVYVNEGEKAAEAFRERGLVATCQPVGGDKEQPGSKWLQPHTDALRGAKVVIVADRDETGEKYARYVAQALKKTALSVMVVQSKTEGEKDDAFNHFKAGYSVEEFVRRPDLERKEDAPTLEGVSFDPDAFEMVELEHLWEPRIPKGKPILWDADGGTQKTTLLAAIAACFSIGQLPCGDGPCEPIKTAYFHKGEDDSSEIATVFRANGGDLRQITFFDDPNFNLDADGLERLEATIRRGGFGNVVFDALLYFCQHLQREGWKDPQAVLPTLHGLSQVAKETGAAINNIRHTSKGAVGKSASELGFGSVQFRNSHRGQMVMRYHPTERGLVVVTDEKGSLLSPRGEAFAFRRIGNEIQFVADFDNPFDARDTGEARKASKALAKEWLARQLASGPKDKRDVIAAGQAVSLSQRTLERALGEIGGRAQLEGFGPTKRSLWTLETQPAMYWQDKEDIYETP
jgi:hypothetical protein